MLFYPLLQMERCCFVCIAKFYTLKETISFILLFLVSHFCWETYFNGNNQVDTAVRLHRQIKGNG